MVDTVRTRAALQILLANNTSRAISAQDIRDFVASVPVLSSGAGAPASAPASLFEAYFDTTNKNWYIAKGTATAADWNPIILNRGAPVTKTTDFTVGVLEQDIISNRAATNTATLPTASDFPGREINLRTIQAFTVVSASSNVVPLAGGAAGTAILAATAGKWARLVSDGTNWQIMAGN